MLREFFVKGGPVMWPLLGCSLLAMTIILERAMFWLRLRLSHREQQVARALQAAGRADLEFGSK